MKKSLIMLVVATAISILSGAAFAHDHVTHHTCYIVTNNKLSHPYTCSDRNFTREEGMWDTIKFAGKQYNYSQEYDMNAGEQNPQDLYDMKFSTQTLNKLPAKAYSRSTTYPYQVLNELNTMNSPLKGLFCMKNADVEICEKLAD
ncbi:MAG: hypothetical protein KGO49_09280 [Gammaproteobacteria bacterium]|nr:hypothetical protein [Gammaproteobacteria bacterium]